MNGLMEVSEILSGTIVSGTIVLFSIGLLCASLLSLTSHLWPEDASDIINQVNKLLPQTQCGQCGYPGCKPYAAAIVTGAEINRCPPGGEPTIATLAELLGREISPLEESCGVYRPARVAVIREQECIGCMICIQACPVDAIIGARGLMHTVIADECTGCELCVAPCPVDCIDLEELPDSLADSFPHSFPRVDQPCIHCGNCMQECPVDLAPQQLLLFKESSQIADSLGIDDCIECRRCDRVCPSEIPLTATFQNMKRNLSLQKEEVAKAQYAELRYERRQNRLVADAATVRNRPGKVEAVNLLADLRGDG